MCAYAWACVCIVRCTRVPSVYTQLNIYIYYIYCLSSPPKRLSSASVRPRLIYLIFPLRRHRDPPRPPNSLRNSLRRYPSRRLQYLTMYSSFGPRFIYRPIAVVSYNIRLTRLARPRVLQFGLTVFDSVYLYVRQDSTNLFVLDEPNFRCKCVYYYDLKQHLIVNNLLLDSFEITTLSILLCLFFF